MADNGVVAGGRLTDWVSLGVLAAFVPRDAVDDAVAVAGKQARRSDGKLPPHVMVYLVMALALFADDDYEEVAARLTETLTSWGCWDDSWSVPGSGGITQARQRLGYEPMKELFAGVAAPVAEELTVGAFLGPWRLMAIDGLEWDAPDTPENAAAFGFAGAAADDPGRPAYPKVRVVSISECASHVVAEVAMGAVAGKGAGEQSLARTLCPRLEEDWLLIADRNFFNWADWCIAADSGAALLWRVKADLTLPVLAILPDGSYSSVLISPKIRGKARQALLEAARAGQDLDEDQARYVRAVEYEVPDRDGDGKGEVIALVTTITQMTAAPAPLLAEAYHQRWEHETGNAQLKTSLRGPGRVLRSKSPDMVRQEIYGYLLTHYALSALICRAATEAGIDPDRVKFKRTVRIVRRRAADPAAPGSGQCVDPYCQTAAGRQVQPERADLGANGPASSGLRRRGRGCGTVIGFLSSCGSAVAHASGCERFRRSENLTMSADSAMGIPLFLLSAQVRELTDRPQGGGGQGPGRTADLPLFRGPLVTGRPPLLNWLNTCQRRAHPCRFGTYSARSSAQSLHGDSRRAVLITYRTIRRMPGRSRQRALLREAGLSGTSHPHSSAGPVAVWHPYWML